MKARNESLLLLLALLLVAAFLASFVLGVLGGRPRDGVPLVATDAATDTALTEPVARVRVEVLNATRRSGLARHATDVLREAGFDVVYFGNAPDGTPADSSVVIDRVGDSAPAAAVAAALSITRTRSDPDPTLLLEATVILGTDWPTQPVPR
ncbi:MAG: LytR C-terminal domain-containing protein [Longimicrobiales bacterium]